MKKEYVVLAVAILSVVVATTNVKMPLIPLTFNVEFLGFSLFEVFLILLVPMIIEVPQTIVRTVTLLVHRFLLRNKTPKKAFGAYPKLSIIVPAHNEAEYIQNTLDSLLENTYPYKEIIIVDDGSTDETYLKAMTYANNPEVKIVKRDVASGKKAKAVNYGIPFASGDVVVIVDGDTIVERDSIKKIIEPMIQNPDIVGVAGNVRVLNKLGLLARLQAYEYLVGMETGRRFQNLVSGVLVIPGSIGAVRREIQESVGRMPVDTLTEDFDLTLMLHKTKGKIVFEPHSIVWTHVPTSWRGWIRQRRRWAGGQAQVYMRHSNIFFKRRFGRVGSVVAPNNVFMDVVILFAEFVWLSSIFLLFLLNIISVGYLLRLLLVIFFFYLILEVCSAVTAAILSPRKSDLKNAFLIPIVVALYRPLTKFVRMSAYLSVLLRRKLSW
jgi:cellulose synthase/poly-beta-1,6-N-acetylglucosamine synthase-like glycosyltransferase